MAQATMGDVVVRVTATIEAATIPATIPGDRLVVIDKMSLDMKTTTLDQALDETEASVMTEC